MSADLIAQGLAIALFGLVGLGIIYAQRANLPVRSVPAGLGMLATGTAMSLLPAGWYGSWTWPVGIASSTLAGGAIAYYLKGPDLQGLRKAVAQSCADFIADRRMAFLASAFLAAVLLTVPFASLAEGDTGSFWPSYYASWVANLVFFALLGVAGIVVSLHRPEKDDFSRRVRILFGGRHDAAVDHITETIRKIGYYAEEVHRTYRILEFDHARNAALVLVEHRTVTQNFYDDLEATDQAHISFKSDPFDPPMRPVGRLLEFSVNGSTRLRHQVPYDSDKVLEHTEQMDIPRGGRSRVEVINEAWYMLSEEHEYSPNRFAKKIHVTFVYEGNTPGKGVPLSVTVPDNATHKLAYRTPISFPVMTDRKPDLPAFTFQIGVPVEV